MWSRRDPASLLQSWKRARPLHSLSRQHSTGHNQVASRLARLDRGRYNSSRNMFPFKIFTYPTIWQSNPGWTDDYGAANWRTFYVWTGMAVAWLNVSAYPVTGSAPYFFTPQLVYAARTCGFNSNAYPIIGEDYNEYYSAITLGNYLDADSGDAFSPAYSELAFTAPPSSFAVFWIQWDTEMGDDDYYYTNLNENLYGSYPVLHFGGYSATTSDYFGDANADNWAYLTAGLPPQLLPYYTGLDEASDGNPTEGIIMVGSMQIGAQGSNADTGNDGQIQIFQSLFDDLPFPQSRNKFRGSYGDSDIYYPGEIVVDSGAEYINATDYAIEGLQPSANLSSSPLTDLPEYSTLKNLFMPIGGGSGSAVQTVIVTAVGENTLTCGGQVISLAFTAGTGSTSGTHALAFSGGGGSGATGTVTVTSGAISGTALTFGGSGYTSAPTVTFTGIGTGTITATVSPQLTVALPPLFQANSYNGKTVVLPNGSHTYSYYSPGLRTDTVTLPDSTSPALGSAIWPPYLASTLAGTPAGWNTIIVCTPSGGTGVEDVTLMDITPGRAWVTSEPACFGGTAAYQLVASAATITDL